MSVLTYNKITLPYANCTLFRQDPVYDEMGQVDHTMTRYEIMVTCVISADYALLLDGLTLEGVQQRKLIDADGESDVTNPAEIMQRIRQRLSQPRMPLSFTFDGHEMIPQSPAEVVGTVDAKHGPHTDCQLFSLTNQSFMVKFHVIAHYKINDRVSQVGERELGPARGSPVISNRWSERVVLDASGYSTRVRIGRYVIRSDNPDGLTVDDYRSGFAVCSIPTGFVRDSSEYDVSPDGLGLQYRIVDREVFKMPPVPAFEAHGKYIESGTTNGSMHYGQMRLALRASKGVSQTVLLDKAIGIAVTKIIARGAKGSVAGAPPLTLKGKEGLGLITQSIFIVDMYDNAVEVILETLLPARNIDGQTSKRIHGIAALMGGRYATFTPFSEHEDGTPLDIRIPYQGRGTANLALNAAAYYDSNLAGELNRLGKGRIQNFEDNPIVPTDNSEVGENVQTRGQDGIVPGQAGKRAERQKS